MKRTSQAELLLSLVMPPERAAAAVGDLMESERGTFAFWFALKRTALAAVFREMPPGLMAKAVLGAILLSAIFRAAFSGVLYYGGKLVPGMAWWGSLLGVAFLLLMPVLVGRLVGRMLAGREIAAWSTIVFFVVLSSLWWILANPQDLPTRALLQLLTPASLFPMLVGVLLARRTWLRSGGAAA